MIQSARRYVAMNYLFALVAFAITGCAHMGKEEGSQDPPPEITAEMSLDDAIMAALDHGGNTLGQVKQLIKRRGEQEKAGPILQGILEDAIQNYSDQRLLNASHLYFATTRPGLGELFVKMARSSRPLANRIGWRLASIRASKPMADLIERELTYAVQNNEESRVLWPEMATAVAVNRMQESYTLVREGLFRTGEQEFVSAMHALAPEQASSDFLDYLALASAEELRQLTLVNVNLFSSIEILRHLRSVPAPISHPSFSHLFLYSVSRNQALGELAEAVLERYVPSDTEHLAAILAGLPAWVQIAYLEDARRNMTTQKGLLVAELKNVTAKDHVIDEIRDLQR